MNRTQKIIVAGAAGMLLTLGLSLNAANRRERRPERPGMDRGAYCLGVLTQNQKDWGITDAQLKEIQGISQEMKTLHEKAREARRLHRQDRPGRQMAQNGSPDFKALRKEMEARALARVDQQVRMMELRHRLLKVLSPEQQKKLEEALPGGHGHEGRMKNHPRRGSRGTVPPPPPQPDEA